METRVLTFVGPGEMDEAAASEIASEAHRQVGKKGMFTLALSGGRTPQSLFEVLAAEYRLRIPWERTYLFFVDERFVSHRDRASNFRLAKATLIDKVDIPARNIFPIDTSLADAGAAAAAYEAEVTGFFAKAGMQPGFDLVLLGVGEDGHTGSIFPGSRILEETRRLVVAARAGRSHPVRDRVTFTLALLNRSNKVFFVVAGEEKKKAVAASLKRGGPVPPAGLVEAVEEVVWFLGAIEF